MDRPTCATCPHFAEGTAPAEMFDGLCLRSPKQASGETYGTGLHVFRYPPTDRDESCGEHPDFPAFAASLRPAEVAVTKAPPGWPSS